MPALIRTAALLAALSFAPAPKKAPPSRPPSDAAIGDSLTKACMRTDSGKSPLAAVWISPGFLAHLMYANPKEEPEAAAMMSRMLARFQLFLIGNPTGKVDPGVADHAFLRDASGALLPAIPPPPQLGEQLGAGADAVLVAFPSAGSDGKPLTAAGKLELVIRDVGDVPERSYTWELPVRLPAAVNNRIAAERAAWVGVVHKKTLKPDELIPAAVAWLSDIVSVDGRWYMLSWLPREVIHAGVSSGPGGKLTGILVAGSLAQVTPVAVTAMDPKATEEDVQKIVARIRLVDTAGKQFSNAPTDDEFLKAMGEGMKVPGVMMRLMVFPTAADLKQPSGPRLIVLDEQGKEIQSSPWKRPDVLPPALLRLLAPGQPGAGKPSAPLK